VAVAQRLGDGCEPGVERVLCWSLGHWCSRRENIQVIT
jgi:hypothetical protein